MSGSLRENVGKKDAKKCRAAGLIPSVIYGGEEQIHFTINEKAFDKLIFTPEVALIQLSINGKEYKAVLQDVQYHPTGDNVLHADFLQVLDGKPITIGVPVKFTGSAKGVLAGGKLVRKERRLRVKGMEANLPDDITIDISNLALGQSIKVKDVQVENLTILNNPSSVVVLVKTARGAAVAEEEEEAEEGEAATE